MATFDDELFGDLIPRTAPTGQPAAAKAASPVEDDELFGDLLPRAAVAPGAPIPSAVLGDDGYDYLAVQNEAARQTLLNPGMPISELGMLDGRPIAQPAFEVTPDAATLTGNRYVSPSFTSEVGTVNGVRGEQIATVRPTDAWGNAVSGFNSGMASLGAAVEGVPEYVQVRGRVAETTPFMDRLASAFPSLADGSFQIGNTDHSMELGTGIASTLGDLFQRGERGLERMLPGGTAAQRSRDTIARDRLPQILGEYADDMKRYPLGADVEALASAETAADAFELIRQNPATLGRLVAGYGAQSLPQSVPAIAGGALGGLVGGPGGALAGMTAGGGATGFMAQLVPGITEYLAENNLRPDQLNQPDVLRAALEYAEAQSLRSGAAEGALGALSATPLGFGRGLLSRELTNSLVSQPLSQGVLGAVGDTMATGAPLNAGSLLANIGAEGSLAPVEAGPATVSRVVEDRALRRLGYTPAQIEAMPAGKRRIIVRDKVAATAKPAQDGAGAPPPAAAPTVSPDTLGEAPAPAQATTAAPTAPAPAVEPESRPDPVLGDDVFGAFDGVEPAPPAAPTEQPAQVRGGTPPEGAGGIQPTPAPAPTAGLRAATDDADLAPMGAARLAGVQVAATQDDVPADVRARTGDLTGVEGFYDPDTGQVFVIEGNLGSQESTGMTLPQRKRWVAAHERTGHAGVRGAAVAGEGATMAAALDEAGRNPAAKAIADAMMAAEQGRSEAERASPHLLLEEALSELAAASATGDFDAIERRYGVRVPHAQREGVRAALARLYEAMRRALGLEGINDDAIRKILTDARRYADSGRVVGTSRRAQAQARGEVAPAPAPAAVLGDAPVATAAAPEQRSAVELAPPAVKPKPAAATKPKPAAAPRDAELLALGKKKQAARIDGTWYVRERVAGQWQEWVKKPKFDGAIARKAGYQPTTGRVSIPGRGTVQVGSADPRAAKDRQVTGDLYHYLSGVGLNREAWAREGVDPAQFTLRHRISYLFRKEGGLTPSELREALQQDGFLPQDSVKGQATVDDNDAVDLVFRALAGERVWPIDGSADAERMAFEDARRPDDDEDEVHVPGFDDEPADPQAYEDVPFSRAPARAPSGDLFAKPTPREEVDAERKARDAKRDGKTGTGRTDMASGEGELFAGRRPQQADLDGGVEASFDLFAPTRGQRAAPTVLPSEQLKPDGKTGLDLDHRPDYTPELGKKGANAVDGMLRRYGGSVVADAIARDFREKGTAELLGQKVGTADDLAAIAYVYRNPMFEVMRYVFTDDAGTIVGESAVSARMTSAADIYPMGREPMAWLAEQAKRANATGVWLMHNHPSGNPMPSAPDRRSTSALNGAFANFGVKLHGHIVLNHDVYGHIAPDGTVINAAAPIPSRTGPDPLASAEPAKFIGKKGDRIETSAIAAAGRVLYNRAHDGKPVIFFTDANQRVTLAANLDLKALLDRRMRGLGLIAQAGKRSRATFAFIVMSRADFEATPSAAFRMAASRGLLTNVVVIEPDGTPVDVGVRQSLTSGQHFETPSTRKRKAEDSSSTQLYEDADSYTDTAAFKRWSNNAPFVTSAEAMEYAAPSLDLTGSMVDAALDGLPLFSRAPDLRSTNAAPEAGTGERLRADLRAAVEDLGSLATAMSPVRAARAVNRLRALVFDSMRSRARTLEAKHPDAPSLRKLFDLYFEAPGHDRLVPETIPQATEARRNVFLNRVERHLEAAGLHESKMTPAQNRHLRNALLGVDANVPANIRAAAELIRREMDVQREDAVAAGIEIGEVTDIGYLTRLYDDAKIEGDEAGFLRDAGNHYRTHEWRREVGAPRDVLYGDGTFARFVAALRRAAAGNPRLTSLMDTLRSLAQSYRSTSNTHGESAAIRAIVAEVYDAVAADWSRRKATAWLHAIRTPDISRGFNGLLESGAPVTRTRVLAGAADVTLQDWMRTDVREILRAYADTMASKIEEAKRVGTTPEILQGLLDDAAAQGVPKADLEEATRILDTVTGSRQFANPTAQTAVEVASAWTYLTLLGRGLFASLYESTAYAMRTGQLRHVLSPLLMLGRTLSAPLGNTTARDLRRLAVDIGVNGHRAVEDAMMATHVGGEVTNKLVNRITTAFFRGIWLTRLTEAQRAYGVGASVGYLKSLARQYQKVQRVASASPGALVRSPASIYFNELGIADHDAFSDWILRQPAIPKASELFDQDGRPTPMGNAFMVAARRLVKGSIQEVRPEHRTVWQNSPGGRVFGAIMGYSMASYANLLRREFDLSNTLRRNFGAGASAKRGAVALASIAGIYANALIISTLREALFNQARFEDKDDEEILRELASLAAQRTFGLGAVDPIIQMVTGLKYRKSITETAAGATIGTAAQDAQRIARALSGENNPATDTDEYRAMEAVYRSIITPALNVILSRVPGLSGIAIPAASGSNMRKRFAGLFYTEPDAKTDLDDDYTAATKQITGAKAALEDRMGAMPRKQWAAELQKIKAEYPTLLQGLTLDRYVVNEANRKLGRAGAVKTDDQGNPKLKFVAPKGGEGSLYGELEGYPAGNGKTTKGLRDEVGDLTKAINNIRRERDIRVDALAALVGDIPGESADAVRARAAAGDGGKLAGARLRNAVLDDLLADRRKVKRAVVKLVEASEKGKVERGQGKRTLEDVRRGR